MFMFMRKRHWRANGDGGVDFEIVQLSIELKHGQSFTSRWDSRWLKAKQKPLRSRKDHRDRTERENSGPGCSRVPAGDAMDPF